MENEQITIAEQSVPAPASSPAPASAPTPESTSSSAPTASPTSAPEPPSEFDGNTWQLLGWRLLGLLLTVLTFGIAFPWAQVMILRWETKHTSINGKPLRFDGTGLQLLGMSLLWLLLTVITLGIFLIFQPVSYHKWRTRHTRFATQEEILHGDKINVWAIVSAILASILGIILIVSGYNYLRETQIAPTPTLPLFTFPEELTSPIGTTAPQGELYYVNNEKKGLNIRSGPGTDYDILGNMPHGTPVYVFGWDGKWAQIEGGWCSGNYLEKEPPKADHNKDKDTSSSSSKTNSDIVGSWLFMREKSSSVDVVVFQFKADGSFKARSSIVVKGIEEGDDWYWHGSSHTWDVIERPSWKGSYTYDGSALVLEYSTKTVTVYVTPDGNNMHLENPDVIRAHKDMVPMSEEGDPQPVLIRLPKGADTDYDPAKITQAYFED